MHQLLAVDEHERLRISEFWPWDLANRLNRDVGRQPGTSVPGNIRVSRCTRPAGAGRKKDMLDSWDWRHTCSFDSPSPYSLIFL